jgi:hypothetical protein
MSRTAAIVITMVLGLPILAMVAIAAVGGFDPSLLTTLLVGGVVMTFVVGAIFEIKRLLDGEGHHGSEPSHSAQSKALGITVVDAPARPEAATVPPGRSTATAPVDHSTETRIADAQIVEPQIARSPEPEPIIVEHVREAESSAVEPKSVKKARTKRVDATPTEPGPAEPGAPKARRKGTRTKQPTSA